MKKVILTILTSLIFPFAQAQNWLDTVIVRDDNNYVSYYDTVSFREKMPKNVKEELKTNFNKSQDIDSLDFILEVLAYEKYNLIFRIAFSEHVDLYVVKYCVFNSIEYYFFGYDKLNDKISQNPYRINGNWIDNNESGFIYKLNTEPLLLLDDNKENKHNLVLRERVHNGTSYDAIINHYILLDASMNFQLLFCIEAIYQYVNPEINKDIDAKMYRTYFQGKVESVLRFDSQDEEIIGIFEIDIDNQIVKNRCVFNSDYENYLITGSGMDDNQFLKEGYKFHY